MLFAESNILRIAGPVTLSPATPYVQTIPFQTLEK